MSKPISFSKVEHKVFIIVALTTIASAMSIFFVLYSSFYDIMIEDIQHRTVRVNEFAQQNIPLESFYTLNAVTDNTKDEYLVTQEALNNLRQIANVRYLFTAKANAANQPIYVVDGLDPRSEDFRSIGAVIEPEISDIVSRCLGGERVESKDILNTEWGAIFITCWPVKDSRAQTVGATVMEFDAQQMYMKNLDLKVYSVLSCLGIGLFFLLLSWKSVSKVSEPFYKKLAYTDLLTKVHNRTAFELDMENYECQTRREEIDCVLVMYDLDNLKLVNDNFGHREGDHYIQQMANLLEESDLGRIGTTYRIGGDEFTSVVFGASLESVTILVQGLFYEYSSRNTCALECRPSDYFSFSYGMAKFDPQSDRNLHDTLLRADTAMYVFKRQNKPNHNSPHSVQIPGAPAEKAPTKGQPRPLARGSIL